MPRVKFATDRLQKAMSAWRTKMQIAQEMHERFPTKYRNVETPYKALRRAETGAYVDASTAQCIAEALGVPLEDLVEAEESEVVDAREHEPTRIDDSVASQLSTRTQGWMWGGTSALLCTVVLVLWLLNPAKSTDELPLEPNADPTVPSVAPTRFALMVAADLRQMAPALAESAAEVLSLPLVGEAASDGALAADLLALPERYGVDGVVYLTAQHRGRRTGLTLNLATPNEYSRLWSVSTPTAALQSPPESLLVGLQTALRAHVSHGESRHFAPEGTRQYKALDFYLRARELLDQREASSLPTATEAIGLLRSALSLDADYALAHAALCQGLSSLYWIEDTQRYLREAENACATAASLVSTHPEVLIAQRQLQLRSGKLPAVLAAIDSDLAAHPDSAQLLLVSAQARFADYQRSGSKDSLQLALGLLRRAQQLEPEYWSPHFWLGTYAYFGGDMTLALSGLERAAELNPSEVVLANLGSVALCGDDLALAQKGYQEIVERYPANHMGPEMLGSVHHYRGEYDAEIAQRERALKLLSPSRAPEIHQIYGALADAYRLAGDPQAALAEYKRALEVIQRDTLRELDQRDDELYAALYSAFINQLERDAPAQAREEPSSWQWEQFSAESLDTPGLVVAARLAAVRDDRPQTTMYWQRAIQRCPVYARHPEYLSYAQLGSEKLP